MNPLLLIFVKNSISGKVKTRLAQSLGNEAALDIYEKLLAHTRQVTQAFPCQKVVFYSDFIPPENSWPEAHFAAKVQQGADLGERMAHAFQSAFTAEHQPVIIIGSDCPGLTTELLQTALQQLQTHDSVVGPAADGGYYLLAMHELLPEVFENKQWSTDTVLSETLADIMKSEKTVYLLPELTDIDTAADWEKCKHLLT